jgi:hypothetical protein
MNHKESAAQHTHEPWLVSARQDEPRQRKIGTGEEGWLGVALVFGDTEEEADANGRRLVACVNACAGIPTEALECQTKKELTKKLTDTSKELLAALEVLANAASGWSSDDRCKAICNTRATIKKAKEVFNDL